MVDVGQTLNNRYHLLSLEGVGGMAAVYKAQDLALKRLVAVKILHGGRNVGDAFQQEAQAAAKMPHPNIVTVYDINQDQDVSYMVMEYVQGPTLRDLIVAEAPFSIDRALHIAVQICTAVDFIHNQGVIHCDLKPLNILVLPDDNIKITDFGIARDLDQDPTTPAKKAWGTAHYASPELISGKPLTLASDVYAIGIILYELLTGVRPFDGSNASEIARQHILDAPPPIQTTNPRIPRYIRQVLDRALLKEPTKRYRTAGQMGKLLATYRQHGEASTQPLPSLSQDLVQQATPLSVSTPDLDTDSGTVSTVSSPPLQAPMVRFDWTMLVLGLLALAALIGLIPLWGTVIARATARPTPSPTSTTNDRATPTPTVIQETRITPGIPTSTPQEQILVPNLVGQELVKAYELTQERRLRLIILEKKHDTELPTNHIISQAPPPDSQAPPDSEIGVVVSLGPPVVIMPQAVGFPETIMQLNLQDLDLTVFITETWSIEPKGLVIDQNPLAGTEIAAGSTVTLTVSSGPLGEIRANLDYKVSLISCELNKTSFRPGDTLQLDMVWEVLGEMSVPYKLFIHVIDQAGTIITQRDEPPLGGTRPTDTWRVGETLYDLHTIQLPANMPPGRYEVHIGLYYGDRRLPVIDSGLASSQNDAIIVGQLEIQTN